MLFEAAHSPVKPVPQAQLSYGGEKEFDEQDYQSE